MSRENTGVFRPQYEGESLHLLNRIDLELAYAPRRAAATARRPAAASLKMRPHLFWSPSAIIPQGRNLEPLMAWHPVSLGSTGFAPASTRTTNTRLTWVLSRRTWVPEHCRPKGFLLRGGSWIWGNTMTVTRAAAPAHLLSGTTGAETHPDVKSSQ